MYLVFILKKVVFLRSVTKHNTDLKPHKEKKIQTTKLFLFYSTRIYKHNVTYIANLL